MASTYSTNLRLELIGTGEQQGTWGITTNTNLGTLLEEAIGGYVSVTVTDGADTVLTVSNGAADQSRNMTLNFTGALTAARNVIAPAIEKVYLVRNSTTGGFAVTLKVSGQTGVSIPNGATALVYVDGTDVKYLTGSFASYGPIPTTSANNTFTASQIISVTDNTNAALRITQLGTGNALLVEDSANPDSTPFVVDASGNVGIGTLSPGQKLDVIGTIRANAAVGVGDSSINLSGTIVNESDTSKSISLTADPGGVGANSFIGFKVDGQERMRIDSSGNVGIGLTPTGFRLQTYQTGGSTVSAVFKTDQAASYITFNDTANASDTNVRVGSSGNNLAFLTGGSERMRVDSSGNVGIGTNTQSDKLVIAGSTSDTWATNSAGLSINGNAGASGISVISTYLDTTSIRIGAGVTQKTGLLITGQTSASGSTVQFSTGGNERMRIDSSGNLLVTSSGGLGYGTGSGGTVTQTTNRTTGVTINKTNGAITLVSAAGTTTWQSFTVTNSTVAATDVVIVSQKSGTDLYEIHVTAVAAGSFRISYRTTAGTTTEQPVFNFAVIKAVTS